MTCKSIEIVLVGFAVACSGSTSQGRDAARPPTPQGAPNVHIASDPNYMDTAWCHISFVPVQDPVFPTIRRDAFQATAEGVVIAPDSWVEEARTRVPQLRAAADTRGRALLQKATEVVGRPFLQRDFDFLLYFCPFFAGGSAIPGIYPVFPYLSAAVGPLAWPDWIFTDEYMFHEILHRFVLEKIDYAQGTLTLNAVYAAVVDDATFRDAVTAYLGRSATDADMVGFISLVLTHIHVDAIMKQTYVALGETANLQRIESYETENANPHPSYVRAWQIIDALTDAELAAVIAEAR